MHTLIYGQEHAEIGRQIAAALRRAGYRVADLTTDGAPSLEQPARSALIVVFGDNPNEKTLLAAAAAALDGGQHVIPVLVAAGALPKLIDHVAAVNFIEQHDHDGLRARLDEIASGAVGAPMRVLTPKVRRANRQAGWFLAVLAVGMFAVGIYGVGVLGIQAPREEYDALNTEVALTIQAVANPELEQYARLLPRDADSAANYESTLRAVPTAYRALVAGTATAVAAGTPLFVPTQMPSATEATGG